MKKRHLVVVLIMMIAASGLLTGCGSDKPVLNVYNWGEYMDPEVIQMFEDEFQVKVNYKTYPTNEDMYAKLKSGSAEFDVVFPSDYMLERMIKEDMVAKIDMANIPNYSNINDRFKNLPYDPNNEYSVPYFWGTLGILYNTTMVDEQVDSWASLWDEKYAKQILILDSSRDSIGMALKYLGYSLNTTSDAELAEAKALLLEQKPLVLAYVVDETRNMMVQGEAAMALTWSGEAIDLAAENEDLAYALPKEGSNLWFDVAAIPKNSPNQELAEAFINFLNRPDIAYLNASYVGYSTPNTAAYDQLDDEIKSADSYYPSDDVLDRCEVFYDLGDYNDVYHELWLDIMIDNK